MYALGRDLSRSRNSHEPRSLADRQEQQKRSVEPREQWSVAEALLFAALLSSALWAIFAALLYVALA